MTMTQFDDATAVFRGVWTEADAGTDDCVLRDDAGVWERIGGVDRDQLRTAHPMRGHSYKQHGRSDTYHA